MTGTTRSSSRSSNSGRMTTSSSLTAASGEALAVSVPAQGLPCCQPCKDLLSICMQKSHTRSQVLVSAA